MKILARNELTGMALPFTDRTVVVTGIAGDHAFPLRLFHVAAAAADDHGQFALVIKCDRCVGPYHLLRMSDLRTGVAGENDRLFRWLAAALLDVGQIVQAHTEDFLGIRYWRQIRHIRETKVDVPLGLL